MSASIDSADGAAVRIAELVAERDRLAKINRVLMDRVERSLDLQGNEFSLFETAILLENKVAERTAALERALLDLEKSNRELLEAKSEAERANRSKTHFLASASHDLLQPLNAARLFVSALADSATSEVDRQLVGNIDRAFETFELLLRDLLDISKLDAGVIQPDVKHIRVQPILNAMAAEFRALAHEKGLNFRFVPSSAVVLSDGNLLARVLRNLLSNALRYTSEGHVLLGCRRRGYCLSIEVIDTGIGIPEDRLSDVFEEFQRLHSASAMPGGYGLGLAIVRRIAQVLQLDIEVTSRLGRGSRFALCLPYGDPDAIRPARAPAERARLHKQKLSGATILVIDNEPSIQRGMEALLGGWDCAVLTADSALDARQIIAQCECTPDLVIADYHLDHGASGAAAIERVREFIDDPLLPGLIVTADRSPRVAQELDDLGLPFLNKPIKPAKLRSLMSHLLG
ncbi:MAG: hybrid sensor histidine kinase/response regulator [Geminicoccaceae bacterium]